MSPERTLGVLVTLALVSVLAASSRAADTVTLQVIDPQGAGSADDVDVTADPTLLIANGYRLRVIVTRDAGTWTDTYLTLEGSLGAIKIVSSGVAPDVMVVDAITPAGASYTPTTLSVSPPVLQPRWTMAASTTPLAESAEFAVDFALDSRTALHGLPVTLSARLTGTRNGQPVNVSSSVAAKTGMAQLAGVPWMVATAFSNFEHPTLGPGVRVRYRIGIHNTGNVAFRSPDSATPSVEFAIETPVRLHAFRTFSSQKSNPWYDVPTFAGGAPVTPGPDEVKLTSGSVFTSPFEEDFLAEPPTSWARSFSTVHRTTTGLSAEQIGPHVYDGVTDHILLDAFVSCADLDLANGRTGPDWELRVRSVARDVTYDGQVRQLAIGTDDQPISVPLPTALTLYQESCTVRGRSHVQKWPNWDDINGTWAGGRLVGLGADALFEVTFESPLGASSVQDAVIVDRLPIGANYRARVPDYSGALEGVRAMCTADADCGGHGDCIDGQCEGLWGLRAYYCDDVANDFGAQGFIALRASNDCQPAILQGTKDWVPPAGMTTPTHLVLHSATMQARTWNDDGLGAAKFALRMATSFDSPALLENTGWMSGTYDIGDGDTEVTTAFGLEPEAPDTTFRWRDAEAAGSAVDFFEDDAFYRVIDYQCVRVGFNSYYAPTVLAPGECSFLYARVDVRDESPLAANPVFLLDVPPGVRIEGTGDPAAPHPRFVTTSANNGIQLSNYTNVECPDPSGTVSEPVPSSDPFEWRFANGCGVDAAGFSLMVKFCTEESYPFVDGQVLEFDARMTAVDNGPDSPDELCPNGSGGADDGDGVTEANESGNPFFRFTMRVVGNQRMSAYPVCAEGGPAFAVFADNPGGRRLLDVQARFDVPDDTTFAGVSQQTPPTGAIIEVSANTSGPWVAVGDMAAADVRHVRLRGVPDGLELEPFVGHAGFVVHLTSAAPVGTSIGASVTMSSDFETTTALATPFIVGSCQRLTVRKYFDGNANQTQDADEPALSDWSFTVTDSLGGSVGSGVTGADGTWDILLPAGSYTVHEDAAAGSVEYSWSLTTPQDVPVTFVVGGLGATVAFGNDCHCGTDVCQPLACTSLGGQLAACGEVAPLDCDDGDMCTTDGCDPNDLDGDACVNEPVDCGGESGGLFVPVANAAGELVGAIRCALIGDALDCETGADTDGDGRPNLVIHPDLGAACQ